MSKERRIGSPTNDTLALRLSIASLTPFAVCIFLTPKASYRYSDETASNILSNFTIFCLFMPLLVSSALSRKISPTFCQVLSPSSELEIV